jgi:hypothetical protein
LHAFAKASAHERIDSIIRHSTHPFERAAADKRQKNLTQL